MIWGSVAVCAVLTAAVAIALVVGSHRGIQIAAPAKRSAPASVPERLQAQTPSHVKNSSEHEIARLNDALRALAAERDRLADRLESVERTLGDITASVQRPASTRAETAKLENPGLAVPETGGEPRAAEAPPAQRIAATQSQSGPSSPPTGSVMFAPGQVFQPYAAARPAVVPPAPGQPPMQIHATPQTVVIGNAPSSRESLTTRTEFAVDLGSEPNFEALRARWANLRASHGAVLADLRPLVSIREGNRADGIELRLIAGPLSNAGDAARTCASLQTKGVNCLTSVFDGQRLALR